MIEGERTAGRPRNFYVGQIKNYAFEDPKEKASNRIVCIIGVVNQPTS